MISSRFWETLLDVDGVEEAPSRFRDAPALWVNGTEIASSGSPLVTAGG